jgi:hypothetical protein
MRDRDQKIYEEAAALWRSLFDEPPPPWTDGGLILDGIMKRLPDESYDRIASPHLRPSQIARPKTRPSA